MMINVVCNVLRFFNKNTKVLFLGSIVILIFLLLRQCEATKSAEGEVTRIINNQLALDDTIKNYKDKWGNSIGEIKGLKLKIEELNDSIQIEKNKPPITIIETETQIVEKIVKVPVKTIDTVIGTYTSAFTFNDNKKWNKSFRNLNATVPYSISNDSISYGDAIINLKQNIWLSAQLTQDVKTEEIFVRLKTDYPDVKFNNATGILIDSNSKGLNRIRRKSRKTLGIGLQLGVGLGGTGVTPYVGVGLGYTPKFLQW